MLTTSFLLLMLALFPLATIVTPPAPAGCLDRRKGAAYISCSTRFLDDLLSQGIIPKIKLGRKTVVRISDLDAYIESRIQPVGDDQ